SIEPEPKYDTLKNSVHVFGRDQIHNINAFSKRRREERQQNRTPLPTYEKVLSMLNMSHHESFVNNINNVNDADKNLGHNTNNVGKNLDNATYSSLSNLVNTTSTPKISASQNDSDISMPNIEGSQPPSCMKNINEED
ncbi:9260_t:CDS:2, partial [Cetraspora pellucida]